VIKITQKSAKVGFSHLIANSCVSCSHWFQCKLRHWFTL